MFVCSYYHSIVFNVIHAYRNLPCAKAIWYTFIVMKILLKWFVSAAGLLIVSNLVDGFVVDGLYTALIVALILGLLNITIKPLIGLLPLPLNMLTFGLFSFVINAGLIFFVASFVQGFDATFSAALIGSVLLWAISIIAHVITK